MQLVFAFKVLAQVDQRGEEGVIVCFEVERSFFSEYVCHFAFVNQHCALSGSHNQLAGVLYFVGFCGIFVPNQVMFVGVPLYHCRELVVKNVCYTHSSCICSNESVKLMIALWWGQKFFTMTDFPLLSIIHALL